jgi:hypothetical protein
VDPIIPKGERATYRRGERRLKALARSFQRRHKIENKEEIGFTREETRWRLR